MFQHDKIRKPILKTRFSDVGALKYHVGLERVNSKDNKIPNYLNVINKDTGAKSTHLLVQSQKYKHQNNERFISSHWHRFGIFIANFEQISYFVLVFPLLALNK